MCIRPATLPERHTEFMMYVDFVNYYVGAVIGLRHFEKHKCRKLYREYVSVSDEAFAILTLENNWERWMEMARQDDWTTAAVPTKWTVTRDRTASAAKKAQNRESETGNPQARRYRGWSAQGINRYNQLFDQIEAERETSRATTFEDNLLRHFQREEAESNSKKRGGSQRRHHQCPFQDMNCGQTIQLCLIPESRRQQYSQCEMKCIRVVVMRKTRRNKMSYPIIREVMG